MPTVFVSTTRTGCRAVVILAVFAAGAAASRAAAEPSIRTERSCYVVGQRVRVTGQGFAAGRQFDLSVDGIDFGRATTSSGGGFSVTVGLGGLRGIAQHVEQVNASDGSAQADTTVTLTAPAGARILASRGSVTTLRAPVEVWDFSPAGPRRSVYIHYVAPNHSVARTDGLGRTGGQCGYLRTRPRRVFPFAPGNGVWVLQIDTHQAYAPRPTGPVQRIRVSVG